jgi:threonylcarbamoyladenosine tRNA methylthiotransferase MtaB
MPSAGKIAFRPSSRDNNGQRVLTSAFYTLGCKLNQLETESIADGFRAGGFSVGAFGPGADLYVVNSCTVTSKAEQKARRVIRKILVDNPRAAVIVTGCYTQVAEEAVAALGDRVVPVRLDRKDALLDLPLFIEERLPQSAGLLPLLAEWKAGLSGVPGDRFRFTPAEFSFHSRAFLKIQDGCDGSCAYCLVRIARGSSVSLEMPEVVKRVRELEDSGYAEAVLTGVNVSRYKSGAADFPALIGEILSATDRIRLRVSSYEPEMVDDRFLAAVADDRVCPHFHLSVQSGSDAVLSRMRRRYSSARVREAASALRSVKGDPFLAADLIVGFPGESEADFADTRSLAEESGFAWLHVFPFSPRPGTQAATMSGHVTESVAGARAAELGSLSERLKAAYVGRWMGREVGAILERPDTSPRIAVTDNYLKIALTEADDGTSGTRIRVRITSPAPAGTDADAAGAAI